MKRIAMWSGPRNVSTALMRSWGNRTDTVVCDEPLYAHYLVATRIEHPGAQEVIEHHDTDWRLVVERLAAPLPAGKTIQYQKQMAHHLLPEIDLNWLDDLSNCLLIRDPCAVLSSLSEFLPSPTLEDTGLLQQWKVYEYLTTENGMDPPIIDAADILRAPERLLGKLCERIGVQFNSQMLQWPPGTRETDGVWAKYWYAKVYKTTTFGSYRPPKIAVPDNMHDLLRDCRAIYDRLWKRRLRIDDGD